jgi:transaldolase
VIKKSFRQQGAARLLETLRPSAAQVRCNLTFLFSVDSAYVA